MEQTGNRYLQVLNAYITIYFTNMRESTHLQYLLDLIQAPITIIDGGQYHGMQAMLTGALGVAAPVFWQTRRKANQAIGHHRGDRVRSLRDEGRRALTH